MKNKTFILTSCSYSKGVERWVDSVAKNKGDCLPVVIMYEDCFEVPDDFIVYKQDEKWPGVVKRLFPVEKVIEDLGEDNWYVWTDCCDVVLQAPLVDLDSLGADVFVCSEQLKHHQASFWQFIEKSEFFKNLLPLTIYNVGCFAAKGKALKDFVYRLHQFCDTVKIHDGCLDQLFFNKWIRLQNYACIDQLFLCLYSTFTEGHRLETGERIKVIKHKDEQYVMNSKPYSFVHGNGYTKELVNQIKY